MARVHGWRRGGLRGRVDDLVGQFALEPVLAQPMRTLSTGWRRRVSLAQALLPEAALVIIDEPTATLDPDAVGIVGSAMEQYAGKGGSILLATPEPSTIAARDRRQLTVLDGGLVPLRAPSHALSPGSYRVRLVGPSDASPRLPDGPWEVASAGSQTTVSTTEDHLDELLSRALTAGWSIREVSPPGGT